jgi:hypothetical protein
MLKAKVPGHWAAWSKFNPCKEIADRLKREEASYCKARLMRRAVTSYKPICSEKESGPSL